MDAFVCSRTGRIYGLETATSDFVVDPEFLPTCACSFECREDNVSNINRISQTIPVQDCQG